MKPTTKRALLGSAVSAVVVLLCVLYNASAEIALQEAEAACESRHADDRELVSYCDRDKIANPPKGLVVSEAHMDVIRALSRQRSKLATGILVGAIIAGLIAVLPMAWYWLLDRIRELSAAVRS